MFSRSVMFSSTIRRSSWLFRRCYRKLSQHMLSSENLSTDRVSNQLLESITRNKENNMSQSNKRGSLTPLERSENKDINRLRDMITFSCNTKDSIYKVLIDNDKICDISVYNCAIKKCSEKLWWKDCLRIANMVFEKNKKRSIYFYAILFNAAAVNDKFNDIYPKFYKKMMNDINTKQITEYSAPPSTTTNNSNNNNNNNNTNAMSSVVLNSLLKGCVKRGNLETADEIWKLYDKLKIDKNNISFNTIINAYANGNNIRKAEEIFLQCKEPSAKTINSFLNGLSKARKYDKFEEYKILVSKKYNFPTRIEDCNMIMSSYLRFKMPEKSIEIFNQIIAKEKKFKPDHLTLGMLQVAYYKMQKKCIRINTDTDEETIKMNEYYKQVTEIIPNEIKMIGNGGESLLSVSRVDTIIGSILHYYGQNNWHDAWDKIEKVMNEYNYGFWRIEEKSQEWIIDVHLSSIEVVIFGLRYVFVKNRDFIMGLNYDLRILTGRRLHVQGFKKTREYDVKDVVVNEISNWEHGWLINDDDLNVNDGFLLIRKVDICSFYDDLVNEKKFINQKTDTLKRFVDSWTESSKTVI